MEVGRGRRVWLGSRTAAADSQLRLPDEPFAAVIWAADRSVPEEARWRWIGQLLDGGCRYLVCGGEECERWHDEADWALVERGLAARETPPVVLTTWHEGESPHEVLSFAANNTNSGGREFRTYVVLVVGGTSGAVDAIEQAIRPAFASTPQG